MVKKPMDFLDMFGIYNMLCFGSCNYGKLFFFEVQCEFLSCEVGSSNSLTWHLFWFDRLSRVLFRNRPFLQWVCGFGGGAPMGSVREPQKLSLVDVILGGLSPPLQGCQSPVKT